MTSPMASCAARCGGALLCLAVLYLAAVAIMVDLSFSILPREAKMSDFSEQPLTYESLLFQKLCPDIITMFRQRYGAVADVAVPHTRISFPSRVHPNGTVGQVKLGALYYGGDSSKKCGEEPTVIVVHGFTAPGGMDHTVQVARLHLAAMGYKVLVVHLRGHGPSEDPSLDAVTYGYQEMWDVLGAWDAVVNGTLTGGCPQDPSNIGVVCFSMGTRACIMAFGQEERIAGIYLDSVVLNLRKVFAHNFDMMVAPGFSWLFVDPIFHLLRRYYIGDDFKFVNPTTLLQHRKAPGKVGIVHMIEDARVGIEQVELLEEALDGTNFTLVSAMLPHAPQREPHEAAKCTSNFHCETHLMLPQAYAQALCSFFATLFERSNSMCPFDESQGVRVSADRHHPSSRVALK